MPGSRTLAARTLTLRSLTLGALVTALFGIAVTATAQDAAVHGLQKQALSPEVLLAFLGAEPSDVHTGGIPAAAEELFLIPPSSQVVGTLARQEQLQAIIDSDLGSSELRGWLTTAYRSAGWTAIMEQPLRGGFNPSPDPAPAGFCRGDDQVGVDMRERPGGTRLVYYHFRVSGSLPCGEQRRLRDRQLAFPPLVAPSDAEQLGSSGCSGPSGRSVGTSLATDLEAVELLDHYSVQLSDAGWLPLASCWDGPVAVRVYQVHGEDADEALRGLLLINKRPEITGVLLSVAGATEH